MLTAFLSFIPIIGTIVNGITSFLQAKTDLEAKKDADDVAVIQARTMLISQMKDNVVINVLRDFAILFPVTYVNVYIWDRMVEISHPSWVWGVKPLNLPWETYLPVMAVYAFLFGLAYRGSRT